MTRGTNARILHDTGLAVWFGGSLMGAIGLNGAASEVKDPADRARVASIGWARWSPVQAAAAGAHLLGGALVIRSNRSRIEEQDGVAQWTAAKSVLTAAAVGVTVYSGLLGRKLQTAGSVPAEASTTPSAATPPDAAHAMAQLRPLQWALPAITGALVVMSAFMGEQQRPGEVAKGRASLAAKRTLDSA